LLSFLLLPSLKRSIVLLSIGLFYFQNSIASNYYWIGNGGNWNSLSHWATTSGGTTLHTQLPTATDDIFFDANSFTLPGQTVNFNQASMTAHHINCTGVLNNPSWDGGIPNILEIYGSLTLVPNMTVNFTGQIRFLSTTNGQTITTAGKNFAAFLFYSTSGEWTLLDSLNCTGWLNLAAGTLNTNDKTINAEALYSGGSLTRTLNMGASVFNLSGTQACGGTTTGLTLNSGTSVINCTNSNSQFSAIGTFYNVNFTNTAGTATLSRGNYHDVDFAGKGIINGPANFNNVTFHGDGNVGPYSTDTYRCTFNNVNFTEGHNYQLGVLTINGNLNAVGSCLKLISIRPVGNSNNSYITFANPVHLSYVDLRSNIPIGAGPFTVDHSLPFCCNGAWTYVNTPANMYWIGNGGNWNDPNHWSYTSGGPSAGCFPFRDNNVFFDANSFSLPGQSVTIDSNSYCRDMDWTGVNNAPTLVLPTQKRLSIFGSVTLNASMNVNNTGWLEICARTPGKTVTTHGQVLGFVIFGAWGPGGEWTLQDTFTTNNQLSHYSGILNTNNQTINAVSYFIADGTLNMGSSVFNISGRIESWRILTNPSIHINCGTSVINFTNDTASISNSSLSANTGYTLYDVNFMGTGAGFIGGYPLNFHNVVFNGAAYLGHSTAQTCTFNDVVFHKDAEIKSPNTFHNIDFTAGHSYKFESGKTQTITNRWRLPGICSGNITLQTTTPGSFASIIKATDSVQGNYLKVRDIHVGGGATFKAYNSIDQGGNTGWNFTSPPVLGNPGPVSGPTTICEGATGIAFHLSPVQGAFSYQWTVPAGATIVSGQGDTLIIVDFGTASSGDIQVNASDGCNFSNSASNFPVTILPRLTPAVSLTSIQGTMVCPATIVTFTASTSGIGNGIVNYEFKRNGVTVQNNNSSSYMSAIANGDIISCLISVSGSSCYVSTTAVSNDIIMQTSTNAQVVNVNAGAYISINPGQTIQLNANADIGTYLWSPATGLSSASILNPVASPTVTTQYTLTVTTTSGCSASDTLLVDVKVPIPDCGIEPPNAFTPNGDGINDRWIVYKGNCNNYPDVAVYNRYGSLVYQTQHYQNDWEGTYKGKQLPVGTYYAVIRYTINGNMIVKKTDVSILR